METKRIEWIDMAKGIAMVMVILGHMPIPRYLSVFIYGCHMPLFFMLSGYVLRDKGESIGCFCKKKAKSLLKPLFIYSIIIIAFRFVYYVMLVKSVSIFDIKCEVIGILLQMKNGGNYGSVLWFLPCMFLALIVVFILIRKINKTKTHVVVAVVLGIIGSVVYQIVKIIGFHNNLPWCLDYVLLAAAMIYVGYILANNVVIKPIHSLIFGVVYIASCTLSYSTYTYTISLFGETGNMVLIWIQSISGSLMFIGIASALKNRKIPILNYIGKNSLFFYAMQFVVFAAVDMLFYNVLKIEANMASAGILVFDFAYLVVTIILIYFINQVKGKIIEKIPKKRIGNHDAEQC